MKTFNRRKFIKTSSLGIGACSFGVFESRGIPSVKQVVLSQIIDGYADRYFDPWLDPNCKIVLPHSSIKSTAKWMWYPGQKTAHINSRVVHSALRRCRNIGYPGSFCQPVNYAFFRNMITLNSDTELQWVGPLSRIRLKVDGIEGEITRRSASVKAGTHLIEVITDFSKSLPCILIEGSSLSPEGWEVSLDQKNWIKPEYETVFDCRDILPDTTREVVVEIPVDKIVSDNNILKTETGFVFSKDSSLIVDFWHDELGSLAFNVHGEGQLDIITGESIEEVMDTDRNHAEQTPIPTIHITGSQQSILTPECCTRFAHIKSTGACTVDGLLFKANVTPVEYKGNFTCSDNQFNKIWEAGAATIHSCMHDFYLDGIKRDALSWADAVMGMFGGDCVFFDTDIAHNSIVSQLLPLKPSVSDFGILDYPPIIFLGLEHNYLVRGDLDFVKRYKQNFYDMLDLYSSLQDEKGFVNGKNFKNWGFFPDWSITPETGPDRFGIPCYSQILIMKSFEVGSYFASLLNDPRQAEKYNQIAIRLRKSIRDTFWDNSQGAFLNGIDKSGKLDIRLTSFAQVYGILFNLIKPEEYKTIFDKVLDNPERKKLSISLNQLFEMLAYAKANRISTFLDRIRRYWGEMLQLGYSRFAEDIRPWQNPRERLELYGRPFANSLCHVWAGATPVLALSRGLLGVQSTKPGFRECIIKPELAELEWIKGSIPTPFGTITVELNKSKGGKLILPNNVKTTLIGLETESGITELSGPGVYNLKIKKIITL